jgi:uncharacterized protein
MPKIFLPDVNYWIALLVDSHGYSDRARNWLGSVSEPELAFCRVTQQGVLRLLSNRAVMQDAVLSQGQAWSLYDQLFTDRRVRFVDEPAGLEVVWRQLTQKPMATSSYWADAYIAAFAKLHDMTVVTFDRGFSQFSQLDINILT